MLALSVRSKSNSLFARPGYFIGYPRELCQHLSIRKQEARYLPLKAARPMKIDAPRLLAALAFGRAAQVIKPATWSSQISARIYLP